MDWTLLVGCLLAYLLGGVPFGLVIVWLAKGVDIRKFGSGNIGATNASRAFQGWRQSLVFGSIYLLDFAKGWLPTLLGPGWCAQPNLTAAVLLGASAIVGHCASPFLGLRGGKGVATSMGVLAALEFVPLLIALAVFVLVWRVTRQVYLGSLALGLALAAATVLRDPGTAWTERRPVTLLVCLVAVLLFWTHRSNIRGGLSRRRSARHSVSGS